jgi:hypothetical protein
VTRTGITKNCRRANASGIQKQLRQPSRPGEQLTPGEDQQDDAGDRDSDPREVAGRRAVERRSPGMRDEPRRCHAQPGNACGGRTNPARAVLERQEHERARDDPRDCAGGGPYTLREQCDAHDVHGGDRQADARYACPPGCPNDVDHQLRR